MRIKFNSGRWTDEEHQGFLRGLEVYGRGNWGAIGIFVPGRSPLQIEAHAQQNFVEGESVGGSGEVQVARRAPGGQDSFSDPRASSSSSSTASRDGGSSSGGGIGSGGRLLEPSAVAHLVHGAPAFLLEEALYRHIDVCDAAAIGILDGLMPVIANDGVEEQQQQQQASLHGGGYQAVEPIGNLVTHGISCPHRVIWSEPHLGRQLRSCFGMDDVGGVL